MLCPCQRRTPSPTDCPYSYRTSRLVLPHNCPVDLRLAVLARLPLLATPAHLVEVEAGDGVAFTRLCLRCVVLLRLLVLLVVVGLGVGLLRLLLSLLLDLLLAGQMRQHLARRADDKALTAELDGHVLADTVRRRDEARVLDGAGLDERGPLVDLVLLPVAEHGDQFRAVERQAARNLGEGEVPAEHQADRAELRLKDGHLVALAEGHPLLAA